MKNVHSELCFFLSLPPHVSKSVEYNHHPLIFFRIQVALLILLLPGRGDTCKYLPTCIVFLEPKRSCLCAMLAKTKLFHPQIQHILNHEERKFIYLYKWSLELICFRWYLPKMILFWSVSFLLSNFCILNFKSKIIRIKNISFPFYLKEQISEK